MHWHYIHYFTRILLFSITTCERVLLLLLKKQNVSTKLDEKILTTGICVVWGRLQTMAWLLWGFNLKCRSILKTASTLLDSPASLDFEVFDLAVDLICFNCFPSNLTHFPFSDKATLDLLFSFLPTFNTVVVSPSLNLNEVVSEPVLANR